MLCQYLAYPSARRRTYLFVSRLAKLSSAAAASTQSKVATAGELQVQGPPQKSSRLTPRVISDPTWHGIDIEFQTREQTGTIAVAAAAAAVKVPRFPHVNRLPPPPLSLHSSFVLLNRCQR